MWNAWHCQPPRSHDSKCVFIGAGKAIKSLAFFGKHFPCFLARRCQKVRSLAVSKIFLKIGFMTMVLLLVLFPKKKVIDHQSERSFPKRKICYLFTCGLPFQTKSWYSSSSTRNPIQTQLVCHFTCSWKRSQCLNRPPTRDERRVALSSVVGTMMSLHPPIASHTPAPPQSLSPHNLLRDWCAKPF